MIKSVIFDLDGTLIDSMSIWGGVDKEYIENHGGIYTPEISAKLKTMTIEQSAEYFIKSLGLNKTVSEVSDEIAEIVYNQYKYEIPLKENADTITEFLKENGIPFCIATATYKHLAKVVLERHGIYDRFGFILTGEDVNSGKKSPEIYLKCAEIMGTDPTETLVVEDSLHCVETTVKAGFPTVAVYDEFNKKEIDKIKAIADKFIYNLDELKSFWD